VARSDAGWLAEAVSLSTRCPPSRTAFSVGAIVVGPDGQEIARGFSREGDEHVHAEESALRKAAEAGVDVAGGTMYSTLEPCGERRSGSIPCAELLVRRNIRRVVFILAEPALFVIPRGVRTLQSNGIVVETVEDLAERVRVVNAHLLGPVG
jgi:pyrimidine deaminase RibD-like protein